MTEIVINVSYLHAQIQQFLGNGAKYRVNIQYSVEQEPLGIGGGLNRALDYLGDEPFLLISADIWTDYPLQRLQTPLQGLAHLVLVDNPPYHAQGDFSLQEGYVCEASVSNTLNYAGIAVLHPDLVREIKPGASSLTPYLIDAVRAKSVTGEYFIGTWFNVGTKQELASANKYWMQQQIAGLSASV